MLDEIQFDGNSNILRCIVRDTSTGARKTGLSSATSGLIISTIADVEATATAYTVAGSNIETITTLGTYAAPTSAKARFKEVDATNHPGLYEIHLADARFSVSAATKLYVAISGGGAEMDGIVFLNGFSRGSTALTASNIAAAVNVVRKNTALAGFPFKMVDATDLKTAETGITVTATRSINGAAFGACANSPAEVSNGWYTIDLAAGDLNGDTIVLRFTGTGCHPCEIVLTPQPTGA